MSGPVQAGRVTGERDTARPTVVRDLLRRRGARRRGREPGELLLRSAEELGDYPVTVVHSLREWAGIAPEHPLISERARGDWRTVSYGRAAAAADAIGQALLDRGLGPGARCSCCPATAWTTCW